MGHRPQLENLLCKVNEAAPEKPQDDSGTAGGISSTSASVNRYILQLAQEYCGDCKNSFDELSKIIQVEEWERLYCVLLSASRIDVETVLSLSPSGTALGAALAQPSRPTAHTTEFLSHCSSGAWQRADFIPEN